jgi:hypothetical protein
MYLGRQFQCKPTFWTSTPQGILWEFTLVAGPSSPIPSTRRRVSANHAELSQRSTHSRLWNQRRHGDRWSLTPLARRMGFSGCQSALNEIAAARSKLLSPLFTILQGGLFLLWIVAKSPITSDSFARPMIIAVSIVRCALGVPSRPNATSFSLFFQLCHFSASVRVWLGQVVDLSSN